MLLDVDSVTVTYGPVRAVEDVTVQVPEGGIVAAIGSNGAGKSTLLQAIMGMVPLDRGSIRMDGANLDGLETAAVVMQGVALSPEGRRVFPEMTVLENLLMGAFTIRDRRRVSQTLEMVFEYFPVLKDRSAQLAGTLSGGEQQMLAVGRALMSRPRLLLLDEPSLGLAPKIIAGVGQLISALNRDQGLTIFIAEQNAVLALDVADRAYVLQTGRVLREGTAGELAADEELRRAYMGT